MDVLGVMFLFAVAATLLGFPIWEGTRSIRDRRQREREADTSRLEGWSETLRNLNLSDKVGILYTGKHCTGRPVSEFVVLTYSAGPKHRLVV